MKKHGNIRNVIKTIKHNKSIYRLLHFFWQPIGGIRNYISKKNSTKRAIRNILDNKSEKRIYYFGIPNHTNLGDWAQTYCIFNYIAKYWPEYKMVLIRNSRTAFDKRFIYTLKTNIHADDIIMIQGGYIFRDDSILCEAYSRILNAFQDNKIVFFPCTILFNNKEKWEKIVDALEKHPHTLLLARDRVSYEVAKKWLVNTRVECYPDVVTTLIGTQPEPISNRDIILCVRNDSEKLYSQKDLLRLKSELLKYVSNVDVTDTTCYDYGPEYIFNHMEEVVLAKIKEFSQYKLIITDRYHGVIFSLIANVPVIVLSSNDHKVKTGLKWFEGVYDGAFYFAESITKAITLSKKILDKRQSCKNNSYMEAAYYAKLRQIIENL